MSGFVYAITDGRGRVKIGWSANPRRRLSKIKSDCPSAASLLGLIPATIKQEREAHKLLAPWKANREWFRLEGPVLAFVEMLPKPQIRSPALNPHREIRIGDSALRRWRKQNCIDLRALAARAGITAGHLSWIERGKKAPSLAVASKLSRATADSAGNPAVSIEGLIPQSEAAE